MPLFLITPIKKATDEFKNTNLHADLIEAIKLQKPHSFELSLLGRFLVAKLAKLEQTELEHFLRQSLKSFRYKKTFWSISHKRAFIAVAIDSKPVGVDLEINIPKKKRLFRIFNNNEWKVLGRKSWTNFYIGWTAKETCLKKLSLNLDQLSKLQIISKIGPHIFLRYRQKKIAIRIIKDKKIILAVSE